MCFDTTSTTAHGRDRAVVMLGSALVALDAARGTADEPGAFQHYLNMSRYWLEWLTPKEMTEYADRLAARLRTQWTTIAA